MKASARSAATYEDTLGKSTVALKKADTKARPSHASSRGALASSDFWFAPKSLKAVTVGLEAGADHTEEEEERTRARAGSPVHARGSGVRGGPHGRGGGSSQNKC